MRDKLEKRIFEDPSDLQRHQEYAAFLKKQRDPRGELIEVQIALEAQDLDRETQFELERKERRLLNEHGRQWLGELAGYVLMKGTATANFQAKPGCQIWFVRGWVDGLQLDELNLKIATVLLKAPEMKLFRRLVLTEALNASCDYLHEWGLLDKIKELDLSFGRIGDKGALVLAADKSIRKLEMLDLTGNQITEVGQTALRKSFPKVLIEDQSVLSVSLPISKSAAIETDTEIDVAHLVLDEGDTVDLLPRDEDDDESDDESDE